jgi:glycosyltransferase involved in cell wall biosynthesis
VPELHLLLTGPARGYVRAGLERLGIPHRHVHLPDVESVAQVYPAIDVCLVTSRDEGGPRAVLEAMATRVSLVTTKVGQAADLVRHGENGWMVEPEDVEGLVDCVLRVATAGAPDLDPVLEAGRAVAEATSYDALRPSWRALLDGFVSLPEA